MSNEPRIKSLTLRNFKGIGDEPQTIEFKPITLLFGANSAGKSTVMQAFLYLKEVLNGNVDPQFSVMGGKSIYLGGFKRLAHRDEHGQKFHKDIEISVSMYLPNGLQDDFLSI